MMAPSPPLSVGSIVKYLAVGRLPPDDAAVFKVLGTKRLESNSQSLIKYRLAVTDGADKFNQALIVVDGDDEALPREGDIVDFGNPAGRTSNRIEIVQNKSIWVIHSFRALNNKNGDVNSFTSESVLQPVAVPEVPSTPSTSKLASTSASAPRPPSKRGFPAGGASSSLSTAKRSLFDSRQEGLEATHPIKDLNPYQNKYTIRARVTQKSDLKAWSSSKGQGYVFNVTLQDESGEIRASAFNEEAKKFHPLLEEGKVYFVSHAQVKPKNSAFNKTSHSFELGLNQYAVIRECRSSCIALPKINYSFVPIADIARRSIKDIVDVIGICTNADDVREITSRNSGRQMKKREITLLDDSDGGSMISLTLWRDKAESFDGSKRVVAVKAAEVNEWNGKTLNLSFDGSIEVDPDIDEAKRLVDWYATFNSDAPLSASSSQLATNTASEEEQSLGEIKLAFQNVVHAEQTRFCKVSVFVTTINTNNFSYVACPTETCRKKMTPADSAGETFRCFKCNLTTASAERRYVLRVGAADATDHQWITLFDEVASQVIGCSATELQRLNNSAPKEFDRTIKRAMFVKYCFRVKCSLENYNDENKLKMTAIALEQPPKKTSSEVKLDISKFENSLLK